MEKGIVIKLLTKKNTMYRLIGTLGVFRQSSETSLERTSEG